jgi:hypothetical protein
VRILPLGKDGSEGPWDGNDERDPFVDNPSELLSTEIQFNVRIDAVNYAAEKENIKQPGKCVYDNTWIRYKFNVADPHEDWSVSLSYNRPHMRPTFNYCKTHSVLIDEKVVRHLNSGKMPFEVWAHRTEIKKELFRRRSMSIVNAFRVTGELMQLSRERMRCSDDSNETTS